MIKNFTHKQAKSTKYLCMFSCMCSLCFNKGLRIPFMGVPITGVIMGNRPQDRKFSRNIGKAFQVHMLEEHNIEIRSNGNGGWTGVKV